MVKHTQAIRRQKPTIVWVWVCLTNLWVLWCFLGVSYIQPLSVLCSRFLTALYLPCLCPNGYGVIDFFLYNFLFQKVIRHIRKLKGKGATGRFRRTQPWCRVLEIINFSHIPTFCSLSNLPSNKLTMLTNANYMSSCLFTDIFQVLYLHHTYMVSLLLTLLLFYLMIVIC